MKKIICIAYIIIASLEINLYSEIFKKISKDGSIEFYNVKDDEETNKINLSSIYDVLIEKISTREGISPFLIKAIIKVESGFNPKAVSPAGAMGLMQLMQATANYYDVKNPFNPEENLEAGIKHLKGLLNSLNRDIPLALAAYHAGMGIVKKRMSVPEIDSTIDYVNKVMSFYTGKKDYSVKVKKLYQKISKDGTLLIYSK